ncbi:MAG: hypothetical protein D6B26_01365 [Spirochaetaceae bacterium]|nr:MAG: hypothetical protein D6B26_01365 [Spirochaetaceae bacterium]
MDQGLDRITSSGSSGDQGGSIIDKILAIFSAANDPERNKKRKLKLIGKSLSKQKFKFYKVRSSEALPGLGKLFFEVYKLISPAQQILQGAESSQAIKTIVIESYLNEDLIEVLSQFREESIRELAEKYDAKKLASIMKDHIITFFGAFDGATVRDIQQTYFMVSSFIDLVRFDYFFVLKKFDSSMQEHNTSYSPKFETINAEYVVDDLKEFVDLLQVLPFDADWDKVFDVFRAYRNVDVVDRGKWKKLLAQLYSIKRSGILIQMAQHAGGDPDFNPIKKVSVEKIVDPYLNKLKSQTEITIQKILNEQRNNRVTNLVKKVFGTTVVARAKHYTDKANVMFSKRMMGGFTHTDAINYLKAFLVDYFKKDVRELHDLLVIRGQWSAQIMSNQLSAAFHELMEMSQKIVEFDESLSEEGEMGMKLKRAMGRVVEKDPATTKLLRQQLEEVNKKAQFYVNNSAQNLIQLGRGIKNVMEDYGKKDDPLILNWRELESVSEQPIDERLKETYAKMYYFVQLLQIYAKGS